MEITTSDTEACKNMKHDSYLNSFKIICVYTHTHTHILGQHKCEIYTQTDYKKNTLIAKILKITPILDKLLEYKRNWIQHVNRMPCNRLPRVMKHYSPTGRRNHGRPSKGLLAGYVRPERVNK